MAEDEGAPERFRLPLEYASTGDPVDDNPFAPDDPRNGMWAEETREAETKASHFKSTALLDGTASTDLGFVRLVGALFNTWAKRGAAVVWDEPTLRVYDSWLVAYANGWIKTINAHYAANPHLGSPETVLEPLRSMLAGLVEAWKATARRFLTTLRREPVPEPPFVPPDTVSRDVVARRRRVLGDYRRREGLSAQDFARRAQMSETAIRGIVNEDRHRYGKPTQERLLTVLGVPLPEWYEP